MEEAEAWPDACREAEVGEFAGRLVATATGTAVRIAELAPVRRAARGVEVPVRFAVAEGEIAWRARVGDGDRGVATEGLLR